MREPPPGVADDAIAALLEQHWSIRVASIHHLPWGFGAWHWRVDDSDGARWFVTADETPDAARRLELEATYAAARELHSRGLEFVVPSVPSRSGRMVAAIEGYAVSLAAWVFGEQPTGALTADAAEATAAMLRRLHREPPPPGTRAWMPALPGRADLERMPVLLSRDWTGGPLSRDAEGVVNEHHARIPAWLSRYDARVEQALAGRGDWVLTHGEPGLHNQIVTPSGRRWVDWESMRVAPRERDLTDLARTGGSAHGVRVGADPGLLELFDLRWRLDEIATFSAWLRGPHTGTASDRVALGGLIEELTREDWVTGN
ncbi:phosphotransferase [Occultella glacieicola]|nr:phosphotransferase [Occultella glacieicola]